MGVVLIIFGCDHNGLVMLRLPFASFLKLVHVTPYLMMIHLIACLAKLKKLPVPF